MTHRKHDGAELGARRKFPLELDVGPAASGPLSWGHRAAAREQGLACFLRLLAVQGGGCPARRDGVVLGGGCSLLGCLPSRAVAVKEAPSSLETC